MNFVSFRFWVVLFALAIIYAAIRGLLGWKSWPKQNDRLYLLLGSLVLFGMEDLKSLCIFLAVSAFIFFCISNKKTRETHSKLIVGIIVTVSIMPLLFFKYGDFLGIVDNQETRFSDLVIPIGLSFYTFQLVSLYIDSRRDALENLETEPAIKGASPGSGKITALNFLNFASFFPQIVAGPIERRSNLLPQLESFQFRIDPADLVAGLRWVVIGLFYKLMVADSLASSSDWIYNKFESPMVIHLANLSFGLRIYGDFAGYSFIALGIARIFGVSLTQNFISPYTQTSLRSFWRCWHVSLTQWLRDYVYIPLGGKKILWASLATFLVSGIWHGAGWTFLIWGALHGIGVSVWKVGKNSSSFRQGLMWLVTIGFAMTAWMPFYQWDPGLLAYKAGRILDIPGYLENPLQELKVLCGGLGGVVYFGVALALGVAVIALEFASKHLRHDPYAWGKSTPVQMVMIVLLISCSPVVDSGFIYFSF